MLLLDTNVVSDLRRPERAGAALLEWATRSAAEPSFLSAITMSEIELGMLSLERRDAAQAAPLRRWFETDLLPRFRDRVLVVDLAVARAAAPLHVPNRRPFPDALIAATAIVHGLTLVTRNVRDFAGLGVRLLNPWDPA